MFYSSNNILVEKEKIIIAKFSNTDNPILAVSTDKFKITFFKEDGNLIPQHDLLKKSIVTSLCWQPSDLILSYGLKDGHIGVVM